MKETVKTRPANSRTHCIVCSITGFAVMLLACCLYLKFGSMSWDEPAALWAKIIFYPGILVGRFLFFEANLTVNQSTCGGVLAMSLIGGIFGCGLGISKFKSANSI